MCFDKVDYCSSTKNLSEVENCPNFKFVKGNLLSADLIKYAALATHTHTQLGNVSPGRCLATCAYNAKHAAHTRVTLFDLTLRYVLETEKVDTIIHAAAQTHVDNSFGNSFAFTDNNVMGTHVLIETAKNCAIKRFIHVSTDEVNSTCPHVAIPRGTTLDLRV